MTAGNASGINDGAAAIVLATAEAAEAAGLKPKARILGYAHRRGAAGGDGHRAGAGGAGSCSSSCGLTVDDFDVIESNEAFAAQALAVNKGLGLDPGEGEPERRRDRARPPGRRDRRDPRRSRRSTSWSGPAAGAASSPCASAAARGSRWPSSGSEARRDCFTTPAGAYCAPARGLPEAIGPRD